jgi:hypothetical protein
MRYAQLYSFALDTIHDAPDFQFDDKNLVDAIVLVDLAKEVVRPSLSRFYEKPADLKVEILRLRDQLRREKANGKKPSKKEV